MDVREEYADEHVRNVVHVGDVRLRRRLQTPAGVLQSRSKPQRASQQLSRQPLRQQKLPDHVSMRQLL